MLRSVYRRTFSAALRRRLSPALHPLLTLVRWWATRAASGAVLTGPFSGMKLPPREIPLPVRLGTYELELQPAFAAIWERKFAHILDVGAGVGYYAIGAALWQPHAKVICWEADQRYHETINAMISLNGVAERVELRGYCDPAEIEARANLFDGALLIVDVEGYEAILLDPDAFSALKTATIIVEFHSNIVGDCRDLLRRRFEPTHNVETFYPRHRTAEDFPLFHLRNSRLFRNSAAQSIVERPSWSEGYHGWFLMQPRSENAPMGS